MTGYLRRFESLLFDPPRLALGQAGGAALVVLRYLYALTRDLVAGDLNMRAMSLVYTTLLSVVPLCAFCFSVLKGLGFEQSLQPLVFEFFRPLGERAPELTERVLSFVDHLQGRVLGSLGLAFLIWTVLSVIQKVEESCNHIWHVDRTRSFARRVSEYLGVLVAGPMLMVTALGLLATLSAQAPVAWLASHEPFGTLLVLLGRLGPLALVTAGFAFLYSFVPNTRVRLPVALAAGLAAGAVWIAAGVAFTRLVAYSTQMMAVYASFAIVLLALMWIWLNWLVLLMGALLAFYLQNPEYLRSGSRDVLPTARLAERLALSVMYLVARSFASAAARPSVASLAETLELPSSALGPVVDALAAAGLLERNDDERLLPGRDPRRIMLDEVVAAVRDGGGGGRSMTLRQAAIVPAAEAAAARVEAAIAAALGARSLADFAAEEPVPQSPPAAR